MTGETERRTVLKAGAAIVGASMLPGVAQAQGAAGHAFAVRDLVYSKSGGKERLARLYQPAGSGPFPAVLQAPIDMAIGQGTLLLLAYQLAWAVSLVMAGRLMLSRAVRTLVIQGG